MPDFDQREVLKIALISCIVNVSKYESFCELNPSLDVPLLLKAYSFSKLIKYSIDRAETAHACAKTRNFESP